MVKPDSLTWERVRRAGQDLLKENIPEEALTWGQFKTKLAAALDIDVVLLKAYREPLVRELAAHAASRADEGNQDDDGDSDKMTALRAMARAMNLGPKPLVGLKEMKREDAERTLKKRLIDAGAEFKHAFPSAREIARARRKTETAKDLEGIDLSNVVPGSRRRRRSEDDNTSPPKKKRRSVEVSDSECSGEESESCSEEEEWAP